jgi:hypothetical protein
VEWRERKKGHVGSAGQDWFFAQLDGDNNTVKDKITDLSAAEFAADLDFINGI